MSKRTVVAPQAGSQADFINCRCDIVFYGGAAGSKSKVLILLP